MYRNEDARGVFLAQDLERQLALNVDQVRGEQSLPLPRNVIVQNVHLQ